MDPVQFHKLLGDETRLRTLLLIMQSGELCVCELTAALDEIQPKISRHLGLLRKQKILQDRREGQWVYYRLHPELPAWALAVLEQTLAGNRNFIAKSFDQLVRQECVSTSASKSCC